LAPQIRALLSSGADLLEVRLDTFPSTFAPLSYALPSSLALMKTLRKKTGLPLILTCRSPREAGRPVPANRRLSDVNRLALLEALIPWCELTDIEARSSIAGDVTRWAHHKGRAVIHSFHQFSGPLRFPVYDRWARQSARMGGDLFKIAVPARSEKELERFLVWGLNLPHPRKVLIAMGREGLPSRVLGFCFGSLLTYGHLGQCAAPGQMHVKDLGKAVRNIYSR